MRRFERFRLGRSSSTAAPQGLAPATSSATRRYPNSQPSPGSWCAPPGLLPGWNWTPENAGLLSRLDRAPRWVGVWYRTPLIDRWAHVWMWHHGAWDIVPVPDDKGAGQT